jgi:cytochrome P450
MWFGPKPRVNISDPELIKDILNKNYDFPKPHTNPLVKLLAYGLVSLEGEQWSKHRKIINPAFHLEKLKASLCFYSLHSQHILSKSLAVRFKTN